MNRVLGKTILGEARSLEYYDIQRKWAIGPGLASPKPLGLLSSKEYLTCVIGGSFSIYGEHVSDTAGYSFIYDSYSVDTIGAFDILLASYYGEYLGATSVYNSQTSYIDGTAFVYNPRTVYLSGQHLIAFSEYSVDITGCSTQGYTNWNADILGVFDQVAHRWDSSFVGYSCIHNEYELVAEGQYSVGFVLSFVSDILGRGVLINRYDNTLVGANRVYRSQSADVFGRYSTSIDPYTSEIIGQSTLGYNDWSSILSGVSGIIEGYKIDHFGAYRLANQSFDRYEAYIGIDSEPDFSTPLSVFTNLPVQITGFLIEGQHKYNFVVRKRNQYNLSSYNREAWSLELDSNGNPVLGKPSAPTFELSQSGGLVRVSARYPWASEPDKQATHWAIFTHQGTDVEETFNDIPTVIEIDKREPVAKLEWDLDPISHGVQINVVLKVFYERFGSTSQSEFSDLKSYVVDLEGPNAPTGFVFYARQ